MPSIKPLLLLSLLLSLSLSACQKSGTCAGKDLLVEVSGNHEHAVRVPRRP